MARAGDDLGIGHLVEQEDHFGMGEGVEAHQGRVIKNGRVEFNPGGNAVPVIVDCLSPVAADMTDGTHEKGV